MKYKVYWIKAIAIGLTLISLSAIVYLKINPGYISCSESEFALPRIAHAGGGFKSMTYTDSIDALNLNHNRYDLFEIDFITTSDNEIVCMHDWDEGSPERTFGLKFTEPPTFNEFVKLTQANTKYKNCTLSSLIAWLNENPNKRIVTDVKDHNIHVLSEIAKSFPDFAERFIPQIYSPSEYDPVRNLGYKHIIFTIYRYGKGNYSKILRDAKSMDLFALTMPADRAKELAPRAKCMGIPTYAHTINTESELQKLRSQGITEIYTDWLAPTP